MKKLILFAILLLAVPVAFSKEAGQEEDVISLGSVSCEDYEKKRIDYNQKVWFWVWGIAYRFENTNENLSKNELNEILVPVEGNVSFIKKSDFWDRFTIGLFGFCLASGFVCAFSDTYSPVQFVTGSMSLLSLVSLNFTNIASETYRMHAVDNYNLYLTE